MVAELFFSLHRLKYIFYRRRFRLYWILTGPSFAVSVSRAQICKRLRSPEIDSKELIPPDWKSIPEPEILSFKEPRNRFHGMNSASLFSLAGRYDSHIPTRFQAPIDCLKIPAMFSLKGLQIRALY
jgi:hypothetical protein